MAITYKSQGSGVSTETSGAALSPLCPATVDAGDILIAHVFWEGTATAPSTPSGWELLGSSPYVIETTIARHWVFGKIAAGTEDGAAVAFGSPAVTTQRAARIYSFAGREGGTILELVTGFSHLSHATDPQMPTVTTTIAGALAVALVAQNDNNATGDATGESGGDWVEAVAEYTVALTPGFTLQIQTTTPTGNPGTVSGGSVATTNDPCGVIGFQIKQNNNQSVSAGVGQVDLAGFAPVVVATNNIIVSALLGVLSLVGFEPTVVASDNRVVSPDFGEVAITAFAPTVDIGVNTAPGVGDVQLAGFSPSVVTSDHKIVLPDVGVLTINGFTSTVQTPIIVLSGVGDLLLTGFIPIVSTSDHKVVLPDVGQVLLTGFEPDVDAGAGVGANPGFGQVLLTGFDPAIVASDHKIVLPDVGALVLSGFEPLVVASDHKLVLAALGELVIVGFEPSLDSNIEVEPGAGELIITGFEPSVEGVVDLPELPEDGIEVLDLVTRHVIDADSVEAAHGIVKSDNATTHSITYIYL